MILFHPCFELWIVFLRPVILQSCLHSAVGRSLLCMGGRVSSFDPEWIPRSLLQEVPGENRALSR